MAQIDPQPMADRKPNLFIIGSPKCGTTTLHGLLEQHPQVYMCSPKEPRFFSRDSEYEKGYDWYLDTYFKDAGGYRVRGEATPTYLAMNKKTAPRIKQFLNGQEAKFIAIFRNPIDRAYSHYWFNRNTKFKNQEDLLSFEAALAAEDERLQSHPEFQEQGVVSYAYFRTGLYEEQVQTYIAEFGRENCLFLLFEDVFPANFQATVHKIEDFLGVDQADLDYTKKKESIRPRSKSLTAFIRKSRTIRAALAQFLPARFRSKLKSTVIDFNNVPFKYPKMPPETRKMLFEKFKPSMTRLERFLDRDLSHWH